MSKTLILVVLLITAALAASTLGCGKGRPSASQAGADGQTRNVLKVLGMQYGQYLGAHNETPPKNEAEWRSFLNSRMGELEQFNVKSVDDLAKSHRDEHPFKVIYGAKISDPDNPDFAWAAYEQTGANGVRMAANTRGGVYELSAEEFSRRIPGQ